MATDLELLQGLTRPLPTSRDFMTVPFGWGLTWLKARAEANTRLARVGVFGDSISVGEIGSDWLTKGYVPLLRAELQSTYGDGGGGYITHNYRTGGNAGGGQVTTTGAWTDVDTEGGILRRSLKPTTAGNGATITLPVRGTSLDLWFRTDLLFGTFHYQVDGGSFVAVPLTATPSILKVTVTGLAPGGHTVVVRATTGDGRFYGVRGRNATGVIVENMSLTQTQLNDVRTATTGVAATDPYDNNMIARTVEAVAPLDVAVLALGAADVGTDVDDSTFLSNTWDALSAFHNSVVKAGLSVTRPPDIVVIAENIGKADTLPPFVQYERDWTQMHAALKDFASSVGAAFVDVWSAGRRTWDFWQAFGYWGTGNTDFIHPGDLGHRAYADLVRPLFFF